VESKFATLDRNLKTMQHEMLLDAIQEALRKSEHISTFQTARLLQLSLDIAFDKYGVDFQVARALELMRKSIPLAMGIDEMDINRLRLLLEKLPEQYSASRDTIIPLLEPRELSFGELCEVAVPSNGAETEGTESESMPQS
jgi:hypothetical protein